MISDATFYYSVSFQGFFSDSYWWEAYEVRQVHVAVGIEQHIIGLDISMDDILAVDVAQSTAKFCNPESDCLFRERLSRDVES